MDIPTTTLIGLKKASNSVSPLADAFGVFFGKKGILNKYLIGKIKIK